MPRPVDQSILSNIDSVLNNASGGNTLTVTSPFDLKDLATVPMSSTDDVAMAFSRARRAQVAWSQLPVTQRAKIATRFASLLLRDRDQILDLIQAENGKSRSSAFEEFIDVYQWSSYLARHSAKILRTRRRSGAMPLLTHTTEDHLPKGVIGVITPWNYPLTLPATDVLPALIAGNGVVLKPDSMTPLTGIVVAKMLYRAGVPRDLLQVVVGPGSVLGSAMIDHADYMMFTGSTKVGRIIATQCAQRLIGISAELGGKNAMLVLEDADPIRAARGALHACFSNSGQLCVSIERIYIHRRHWDVFVDEFISRVKDMRLTGGYTWDADMGSLVSEAQLKTVTSHVNEALEVGASLLAGGKTRPDLGPYFFEPTVLTGVPKEATLHGQETFGPVVSLYPVSSDAEAVAAANDSEYGLSASVWSRRKGRQTARQIRAGAVNVNEGYGAAWASYGAPMGGIGNSGIGRRHGAEGLLKYTEGQTVAQQRLLPVAGPFGYPRERWANLLTTGVKLLNYRP